MKKFKLQLVIILILVIILYNFKPLNINLNHPVSNTFYRNMQFLHSKFIFVNIFVTNLFVGLILSIIGFFTGGILTLLILIWNFFLLWLVYFPVFTTNRNISIILYFSKHLPIEIYAFVLFSLIGFRGFKFYTKLIISHELDKELLPNLKELLFPSILLFFSSLIEVI